MVLNAQVETSVKGFKQVTIIYSRILIPWTVHEFVNHIMALHR